MSDKKRNVFPNRTLPREYKDDIYTLAFAKAMFDYYNDGVNKYVNKSTASEFKELENYASGNQSDEYYRTLYSMDTDKKTGKRRGLKPLKWDIIPFAPMVINVVTEILNKRGAELNVSFLDQVSSFDKKLKKAEIWFDNNDGKFFNQQLQQLGLDPKEPEVRVDSKQQLDLYEAEGGIKLNYEIAYEEFLNYVFNYDIKWKDYMSPKLKENLQVWGCAGAMMFVDPVTGKINTRDLDMKNVILMNSRYYDYHDSEFIGEITPVSILNIVKGIKNTTGKIISEEKLESLVSAASGVISAYDINPNMDKIYSTDWYSSPKYGSAALSDMHLPVLDFMYLSEDIVKSPTKPKVRVEIPKDKVRKNEVSSGKLIQEGDKYYKEVEPEQADDLYIRVWRKGKWVINTDLVYDYGLVYDQTEDKDGDPVRPFFVYRVPGNSLMKIIKPNLDQLQLAHMELQAELLKGHGKTLSIDVDSLVDIVMGGEEFSPKDLLKIYKLDNLMLHRKTKAGLPNQQSGNQDPIVEHEGGIGIYLQELMSIIAYHIKMIQTNTGLNDIALAGNPNPETTLGQSEIALGGANNSIANIYNAYRVIKEGCAFSTLMLGQQKAKNDELGIYKDMLGKPTWDSIIEATKRDLRNVAITVRELPNQDEIQRIDQMIQIALTGGKNGNAAITPDEAMQLYKMIKEGTSLSLVTLILQSKRQAREQQQQQYAQQTMEQQGKQNQELAAQQSQAELQKAQMEADIKLKVESELLRIKYEYELKLESMKQSNKPDKATT